MGYFLQTFGSLFSHLVSWEQAIQSPGIALGSLNSNAFVPSLVFTKLNTEDLTPAQTSSTVPCRKQVT